MREEGLLKLFFAGALPPEEAVEILRAMRAHRLARRRAAARDGAEGRGENWSDPFPLIVLQGGIEFNEWFADWCERMEAQTPRLRSRRKGAADVRRPRPPRRRPRPPRRRSSRSPSSCSPARSAARSPTASTPTAPTTRRPRRCKAKERLQDAGLRVPAVIVVVEDAPVADAGDARPGRGARARGPRARPDVAVGHRLLRHPLARLRLQRRPARPTSRSR